VQTKRQTKKRVQRYHHGDLPSAVLRTTVALIEQRGGVEFTMREVADAAGVTHPAVYRHFADKRALLVRIALEGYGLLASDMKAEVDLQAGRSSIAKSVAAVYVAFAVEHPAHFRVMFGPRLNRDEQYPELEAAVTGSYAGLFAAMGGSGTGMSADNRKAHDRSFALWSLVHGYAMLVLDDRIAGLRPDRRKAEARAHVQRLVAPLAASFEVAPPPP
jgi:AcrR family transcriptional regulator